MSKDSNVHEFKLSELYGPELDAYIKRLADLPRVEYDRRRIEEAKRLGIQVKTLDKEVQDRRPRAENGNGQGSTLVLEDPELWPEPVDGDDLLDRLAATFRRYLVLPAGAPEALALWVLHAHTCDAYYHSPRLHITAPEKGCGKTVVLDVLESLTPRSLRTENVSTAVMFRLVDSSRPTLLVDEADTFLRDNEELCGALNAGHRRGGKHLRCEGDKNEVRAFSTFGPVAIAGIGKLPGTLMDRSIAIQMHRARPDERVEPFRADRAFKEDELRQQAARWAADNLSKLSVLEPSTPSWMHNRVEDNWRPLFAIADVAGGEWPSRAREVAGILSKDKEAEESSLRVQLLTDLRTLFADKNKDRLLSEDICTELAEIDERPWPEFSKGKPITTRGLAKQLNHFGIRSGSVRDGDRTGKGYKIEDCEEAFSRYLPSPNVTPSQVNETAAYSELSNVTPHPIVTDGFSPKPKDTAGCDGVTDENGGCEDHDPEREAIRFFDGGGG
tara:strand:- start:241 stop:1740 length:1500 start_codon:yes stop_codon:yes gene_type:complete